MALVGAGVKNYLSENFFLKAGVDARGRGSPPTIPSVQRWMSLTLATRSGSQRHQYPNSGTYRKSGLSMASVALVPVLGATVGLDFWLLLLVALLGAVFVLTFTLWVSWYDRWLRRRRQWGRRRWRWQLRRCGWRRWWLHCTLEIGDAGVHGDDCNDGGHATHRRLAGAHHSAASIP